MRIYRNENVLEQAKKRIRYLFDEFDVVTVSISGGKDSTVIFHLALEIAKEKGKLPLDVMFLDQEIEWTSTVETVRDIMYRPEVHPRWYQFPFKLSNASSNETKFLNCWHPDEEWVREKEPIAITENRYGTDRFHKLLKKVDAVDYPGKKVAQLVGVRTEESPKRLMFVTGTFTYKWISWARKSEGGNFAFYPIYDWSYTDVWKYINDNNLPYNKLYDYQYQRGCAIRDMRVSSPHHEDSVEHLYYMQEVDADLWNKAVKRLKGLATAPKLEKQGFQPTKLPFMFHDWKEYRDYLLEKIVTDADDREFLRKRMHRDDKKFEAERKDGDDLKWLYRVHINAILTNDMDDIKIRSKMTSNVLKTDRKGKRKLDENEKRTENTNCGLPEPEPEQTGCKE